MPDVGGGDGPDRKTLMAVTVMILMFVAGARLSYIIAELLIALPAFYQLIASVDYRRRRILAFLNPWDSTPPSPSRLLACSVRYMVVSKSCLSSTPPVSSLVKIPLW